MSTTIGQLTYNNVFRKIYIFLKYMSDNLQNREYRLVITSLKYLFFGTSHKRDLFATTNIGKFFLRARTTDFITANSAYEFEVMKVISKESMDRDLFLDIGANIGTYTVLLAKKGIKTLSFEPIKYNFNSLNKNVELNSIKDFVSTFNFGFDRVSRKDQFHFSLLNPGASSIHNIEINYQKEKVDVELKVFDKFENAEIRNSIAPIIKIDVEGMELEVLEGMKNFIIEKETVKFILETKHSGEDLIKEKLSSYCDFDFTRIDPFNLLAIKIKK